VKFHASNHIRKLSVSGTWSPVNIANSSYRRRVLGILHSRRRCNARLLPAEKSLPRLPSSTRCVTCTPEGGLLRYARRYEQIRTHMGRWLQAPFLSRKRDSPLRARNRDRAGSVVNPVVKSTSPLTVTVTRARLGEEGCAKGDAYYPREAGWGRERKMWTRACERGARHVLIIPVLITIGNQLRTTAETLPRGCLVPSPFGTQTSDPCDRRHRGGISFPERTNGVFPRPKRISHSSSEIDTVRSITDSVDSFEANSRKARGTGRYMISSCVRTPAGWPGRLYTRADYYEIIHGSSRCTTSSKSSEPER
jgi:hypothetical protein